MSETEADTGSGGTGSGNDGGAYYGVTNFRATCGEEAMAVEEVRAAAPGGPGDVRLVRLKEGNRVCPPGGGVPAEPAGFEHVGLVHATLMGGGTVTGVVYAEPSGTDAPEWFWEAVETTGPRGVSAGGPEDNRPVDIHVYVGEGGSDENITKVVRSLAGVDEVHNCAAQRRSADAEGGR